MIGRNPRRAARGLMLPPKPKLLRHGAGFALLPVPVAPVVRMSSINKMCCALTSDGSETENAPRTLSRRWRGVRPACVSVARSRMRVLGASVSRHCGVRPTQKLQGLDGKRARLIETALGEFGAVERHRNHEHFGGSLTSELRDSIGQHPSKRFGGGVQAIVLERVNGLPHAAPVDGLRNGADKGRRSQSARAAKD